MFRANAQLVAQGRDDVELRVRVLPTSAPLCLLVGLLRPTSPMSSGLRLRLEADELRIVLEHERAHAARRDTAVRLLARVGTFFLWRSTRARLLRALELGAEQSCDEATAERVGDRIRVAETILKVEQLLQATAPVLTPIAAAFGGETVPLRVAALLDAPRRGGSLLPGAACIGTVLLTMLAASAPLHHFTESLLGALTH